jgi:sugar/nucleoside kinase (ribokinase family)
MVVPGTGEVCAVVSGGSNLHGWGGWIGDGDGGGGGGGGDASGVSPPVMSDDDVIGVVSPHSLLLLQCEVPHAVNLRLARAARASGATVILDAGGEDRDPGLELMGCADFLVPNETELARLGARCRRRRREDDGDDAAGGGGAGDDDGGPDDDGVDECGWYGMSPRHADDVQAGIGTALDLRSILRSARALQGRGASNVLVTLGSRGSILVRGGGGSRVPSPPSRRRVMYQPPCPLPPGSSVVDETGAGDCYRAGFAVALLEERRRGAGGAVVGDDDDDDGDDDDDDDDDEGALLARCMEFASAAGALAVTRPGGAPSIPSRSEVEGLLAATAAAPGGGGAGGGAPEEGGRGGAPEAAGAAAGAVPRGGSRGGDGGGDGGGFPFLFGSRLNSMRDRADLVDPASSSPPANPRGYLRRQASVRGLGCVDFNYPQHFEGHWTPEEARAALDGAGLVAGAVCLRYPPEFARGAMNHPDAGMRRGAVDITKRAADAARVLGCNE